MIRQRLTTTLVLGFILLVVVSAVVIMIGTQYQRAERAETRADAAEKQISGTKVDLLLAEQTLDATQAELDVVERDIDEVTRSAARASEVSDQLVGRDAACRFVVKVSDKLLDTSIAYGKAADGVIDGNNGKASDQMRQAGGHLGRVDKLIKQSGYATISDLYDACTPDIDLQLAADKLGVEAPPVGAEAPLPPVSARTAEGGQ
jgi:hypothetical protein